MGSAYFVRNRRLFRSWEWISVLGPILIGSIQLLGQTGATWPDRDWMSMRNSGFLSLPAFAGGEMNPIPCCTRSYTVPTVFPNSRLQECPLHERIANLSSREI